MSRYLWFLWQAFVVVLIWWADHSSAIRYGMKPSPQFAIPAGVAAAWLSTVALSWIWDRLVLLRRRLAAALADNRQASRDRSRL